MDIDIKTVLVVAPHTDDAEFGMGATLFKLARRGGTGIRVLTLSDCVESLPDGFPEWTLRAEARNAAEEIGISKEVVTVDNYPVRRFGEYRQEILEKLVAIKRNYDPEVVFAPAATDIHQDHAVVRREVDRAFKDRSVLGYELTWNCATFSASHIVTVGEGAVAAKCRALQCYASQAGRPYSRDEVIYSLARVRGLQAGSEYGEAFDVGRTIWRLD